MNEKANNSRFSLEKYNNSTNNLSVASLSSLCHTPLPFMSHQRGGYPGGLAAGAQAAQLIYFTGN